ncbi:MAG TPA: undecaprenyl-phosphate galactose phosphotransferase WbaP [Pirellulales bacterium]|jgi:Undecaprenyl-phosphate galactose phosphotransferase WbaP|nr:undecaprenyl-phosphate galactose phosphotransferase WbaP [Pirellulales bacterium]
MSTELLDVNAANNGVLTIPSSVGLSSSPMTQRRPFRPGAYALRRALITSLPLAAADILALALALAIGASVSRLAGAAGIDELVPLLPPISIALVMSFAILGLYPGVGLNPIVELRQTCCGTTVVFCVLLAAVQFNHAVFASARWLLILAWPMALVAIPLARAAARRVCSRGSWWGHRAVVFGSGQSGLAAFAHLESRPWLGLRPVGIVADESDDDASTPSAPVHFGSPDIGLTIAEREGASWAILAMPDRRRDEVLRVIDQHAGAFPHILIMSDLEGLPSLWTCAHECGGMPGLWINDRLLMPVPRIIKRAMDLMLILLASPVVVPVMAFLAVMIKVSSPGPICYSQQRIGLRGRRFKALKFRSMVTDADGKLKLYLASNAEARAEWEADHKLRNDPRITFFGRFLRKTSLDELPQLWNVLRGEMSLVGPRPIVEAEISKYTDRFDLYAKVTPGITGLWQVSGRNDTTYDERVELDAFYTRNWSPWLDLFILARTVKVVLFREGAY